MQSAMQWWLVVLAMVSSAAGCAMLADGVHFGSGIGTLPFKDATEASLVLGLAF